MSLPLNEMKEKARAFYSGLGFALTDDNIDLAVQSLTMPCYANEFHAKYGVEIQNHASLATVGDAYWTAYILFITFTPQSSKSDLTNLKQVIATNIYMDRLAKEWLKPFLFASNNDLTQNDKETGNAKGYATALEAVIGFLFLEYPTSVFDFLKSKFPIEKLIEIMNFFL